MIRVMTIVHLVALLIVFKHVEILVTINVRGVIIIVMVEEDVVARVLVVGVVVISYYFINFETFI